MNTIIQVARENPAYTPWRVLIKSLEDQPPREVAMRDVVVTKRMQTNCALQRDARARKQREAIIDAILATLSEDEPKTTLEIATACGKPNSANNFKRRLMIMLDAGIVQRQSTVNKFGLLAYTWTATP